MSAILTIELDAEVRQKLARLSERTRQPAASLAAEAVACYVEHESRVLDGIASGLEDMKSGRLVSHDDAMDEVDAVIAAASRDK
ncbi:MAG: CopG family transcriptional regulator [Rhodomicrobium sp.]